jgi:hypothetical protein
MTESYPATRTMNDENDFDCCEGCSNPIVNSEDDRLCQSCYDDALAGCEADIATEKRCEEFYEYGH